MLYLFRRNIFYSIHVGRNFGTLGPLSAASMRAAEAAGMDLASLGAETGQRRKSVMRRTVDYNTSFLGAIERRVWQVHTQQNHL